MPDIKIHHWEHMHIGAQIIRTKIRENFVPVMNNMWIIRISKSVESMGKHTIVRITIVQIKQNVRIIRGQIIWVLL